MELDVFGENRNFKEYYSDDYNYKSLFDKSFVVKSIIQKLSQLFSNASFEDESGKETKLLLKLKQPNQIQSTEEFLKDFAINLFVSGYSMIWKHYISFGNFDTLNLIVLSTDTDITSIGKSTITTIVNGKKETIKIDDIIFFYDIEKNHDSVIGRSRLKPLKSQIQNIRDAQFAKKIQIENSGTTVVSPKASNNNNNIDEGLNAPVPIKMTGADGKGMKTQKEEMEDRLNSRGIANRIIVSNKGLDAKNLSAELNDMKFSEVVETDILAIYDAYSMPPELSPYGKNATFENKPAAENALIELEILPLANSLITSLNQEFEKLGKITVNYNHINSVATTRNKMYEVKKTISDTYRELFKDGLIEREEARQQLIANRIIE